MNEIRGCAQMLRWLAFVIINVVGGFDLDGRRGLCFCKMAKPSVCIIFTLDRKIKHGETNGFGVGVVVRGVGFASTC